jgi:arginase
MYQSVGHDVLPGKDTLGHRLNGLQVLAVNAGFGAGNPGTAMGPASLAGQGLAELLGRSIAPFKWCSSDWPRSATDLSVEQRYESVLSVASATASFTNRALNDSNRFLVLGGDHSIAAGTWAGAARALRNVGPIGLIWLDAHMDAHVPQTSPSGNWHGMPVAHLLGYGSAALSGLGGKHASIRPSNLCLVGTRSFEKPEADLLATLGVRVVMIEEVRRRGLQAVLREAVQIVTAQTVGFGISFDVDLIDPNQAPGVGTPVAGGLNSRSLLNALPEIAGHPDCFGLEVVEYNPLLDRQGRTSSVVSRIICTCSLRMTSRRPVWQDAGRRAQRSA